MVARWRMGRDVRFLHARIVSGIVGLRLFPNPDFDEKAAKRWDPERYYTDPTYYKSV